MTVELRQRREELLEQIARNADEIARIDAQLEILRSQELGAQNNLPFYR
jgi:hypothetical protein